MKNIITESLQYWEPRRLVFNGGLAMAVLATTLFHHGSLWALTGQAFAGLLIMAIIANVLYCSAYLVDVFIQMSDYQQVWKRQRWAVLIAGTLFAVALFVMTRD
jgi:hypothetical protein